MVIPPGTFIICIVPCLMHRGHVAIISMLSACIITPLTFSSSLHIWKTFIYFHVYICICVFGKCILECMSRSTSYTTYFLAKLLPSLLSLPRCTLSARLTIAQLNKCTQNNSNNIKQLHNSR